MYACFHIRVYTPMYTRISDRICDEQTKASNSPAWTAPAASSTIFFGFFVSLSLTVTVTPLQVMFLTVELSRCLSATGCCSGSVLIPTGGGSGFSQPIACWAMSVSTYFIRPFFSVFLFPRKTKRAEFRVYTFGKEKKRIRAGGGEDTSSLYWECKAGRRDAGCRQGSWRTREQYMQRDVSFGTMVGVRRRRGGGRCPKLGNYCSLDTGITWRREKVPYLYTCDPPSVRPPIRLSFDR